MAKLKRFLSYTGIFMLAMCLAAGFVILQFLFSNKSSKPEIMAGAEDTTFSQVLNKVMASDNITADFDIVVTLGEEEIKLNGNLGIDLAKVLNASDDILNSIDLSIECNILSGEEIVPFAIKVVNGMAYAKVAENQLKFELSNITQDIGVVLALAGVELPVDDLMANFDMSSLMGIMETITTAPIESGYEISIPLFDYGIVSMIADKDYNITQISIDELNIEGVIAKVNLDVVTNNENFDVTPTESEENGTNVSTLMKFATGFSDIISNKKTAGRITLKTKYFENEFNFGADLNDGIYAYLFGNVLDKNFNIVTRNNNVYVSYNDFKFKTNFNEIENVINFVKEYIEHLTNISIEEEISKEIENIQTTTLEIQEILKTLNTTSVDINEILKGLSFSEDNNKMTLVYEGIKLELTLVDEKISEISLEYLDYKVAISFYERLENFIINDIEFVDYTFYQDILERIVKFIDSKKVKLKTSITLGEQKYIVDIKIDINKNYNFELSTNISGYKIKINVLNNVLYLQLNEQKVSYNINKADSIVNILKPMLSVLDFAEYEEQLEGEIEKLTIQLAEMLNDILNISEEQIVEILKSFAVNYINNNRVDIEIDEYRINFAVSNKDLLNINIDYKDIGVDIDVSDSEWTFDIKRTEYVKLDNVNKVVESVKEIATNKEITLEGTVGYEKYTLPVTIKVAKDYIEMKTTIIDKPVMVIYDKEEVYISVDELKVKTNVIELKYLYEIVLDLLKEKDINEEEFDEVLSQAVESTKNTEINLKEILATLKLASDENSISVKYGEFKIVLGVNATRVDKVKVNYDKVTFEATIQTKVLKTEINTNEYVEYTHFTNIYNKLENVVESKKFSILTTVNFEGKDYEVNAWIDLSKENPAIEITTEIFNLDIKAILLNEIVYIKLNNQQVSYKLENIEDVVAIIGTFIGKEKVDELTGKVEVKVNELKEMLDNLKAELSNKEISELMEGFEIVSLTNNGISLKAGEFELGLEILTKELLNVEFNYNTIKAELVLSDKDFEIEVNEEEYVSLDNANAVVSTVTEILTNKQLELSGEISYKGNKLPLTIKVDLNDGIYVELKTQILSQEVTVIYNGNLYVIADELKFTASKENIDDAIAFVLKILKENNVELDSEDVENVVGTTNELSNISIEEILNKFELSSDKDSLVIKVANAELTFKTGEKLNAVAIKYNEIAGNFEVKTSLEKIEIVENEFVDYTYYEAIFDRVSNFIESKKFYGNITVEVDGKEYGFEVKADLNEKALQISTTIEGYYIQINYAKGVAYLKVNEQQLSYTLPSADEMLGAILVLLEKAGITEEGIAKAVEEVFTKIEEAKAKVVEITEDQVFEILSQLAIENVTNNKTSITYNGIGLGIEICEENVLEASVSYNGLIVNISLNDKAWIFDIEEKEYVSINHIKGIVESVTEIVNNKAVTFEGLVSYDKYSLPITLKVAEKYVEVKTTILEKQVIVVCDNKNVYVSVDNLKVKTNTEELADLYEIILDLLKEKDINEEVVEEATKEVIESVKNTEINLKEILATLKLASDENSISVEYGEFNIVFRVNTDRLDSVKVNFDKFIFDVKVTSEVTKEEIKESEYVEYTHFTNIYNKLENVVESKKFSFTTVVELEGKIYELEGKVDLSKATPAIEVTTNIDGLDIKLTLINEVVYIKLNNQQVSYKVENIEDVIVILGAFIGEEKVKELSKQAEEKADELKEMLENLKEELSNKTVDEILNSFRINSITNNGVSVTVGEIGLSIYALTKELVDVKVSYNTIKTELTLSDKDFEIEVEENKYVSLDNANAVVKTATEIFTNKQVKLSGEVTYKGNKLPLEVRVDLNEGIYVELTTTVLTREIKLIYNGNLYVIVDELKFMASEENIERAIEFIEKALKENEVEVDSKDIENVVDTTNKLSKISIEEILNKFELESNEGSLTIKVSGIELTFKTENELKAVEVTYEGISGNFEVETSLEKTEIVENEFVDYTYYKAIFDRVSNFIESKKFYGNITVEVEGKEYSVDVKADLKESHVQISTTIDEYYIQINIVNGVVYLKVNEQQLSYTMPENEEMLGALMLVLEKAGVTEEGIREKAEEIYGKVEETISKAKDVTEEQVFEIVSKLAIEKVTNNTTSITYDGIGIRLEMCEEVVLEVEVRYNEVLANLTLNDNAWNFDINKDEYVKLDNINKLVETVKEIVESKEITLKGIVGYDKYSLPVTIKVSKDYIEITTTIIEKQVMIIYDREEVYISVDELKVKTNVEELKDLYEIVLDLLKEKEIDKEAVDKATNEIVENIKNTEIDLKEILATLKLASDANSISVKYGEFKIVFGVNETKADKVKVNYDKVSFEATIQAKATKAEINKNEYVEYTHFTNIYNKLENVVENKKFQVVTTVNFEGKDYKVNVWVDLSKATPAIELTTVIDNLNIKATLVNEVVYIKLNNQQVSYKLENIEDLAIMIGAMVGKDNVEQLKLELEAKVNELQQMLDNLKEELSKKEVEELLDGFKLNSLTNNGISLTIGELELNVSLLTKELLNVKVNNNTIKAELTLSDKDFEIEVNKEEYVSLDNTNAVISSAAEILTSKEIELSGEVTYKGNKLPLTIKLDLNDGIYAEIKTTILNQQVTLIYDGNLYVMVGELKFVATSENIEEAMKYILETLKEKDVEIDEEELKEVVNVTEELTTSTIVEMLNKFELSSNEDGITIKVEGIEVTLTTESKLEAVAVNYKEISGNFEVSTIIEKTEINTSEFVDYTYYKAIFDRISNFIESKKFYGNVTVEVDGKEYGFEIKADLTNNVALQISTTIEGYNIQINMLEGVVYVKVNEQKVSYTLPENEEMLGALMLVLEKAGVTEENIAEEIEKITLKVKEAVNKASEITEEEAFEILSKLAVNTLTNNTAEITFNGIVIGIEVCKEEVLELKLAYNEVLANVTLNDNVWVFDIDEKEYVSIDHLKGIIESVVEIVNQKELTMEGTISYEKYSLPIILKVKENYIEVESEILEKRVMIIYERGEIYVSVDELKVKTNTSELRDLYELVLTLLEEKKVDREEIEKAGEELFESIKKTEIDLKEILRTLKLTSDENSITAEYDKFKIKFNLGAKKLEGIELSYDKVKFEAKTTAVVEETEINKNEYVDYTHFTNIYNKLENVVESKKFSFTTVVELEGKIYELEGKVDLSKATPAIEVTTNIDGLYIKVTLVNEVIYIKLNNQQVSYKVENIEDVVMIIGTFIGEEKVNELSAKVEEKVNELKAMLESLKEELSNKTVDEILNSFEINSITNNGVSITVGEIDLSVYALTKELIDAKVNYNTIKAELILSDKDFEIEVEENKYVSLDNASAVVSTVTEVLTNKQLELSGEISYKGNKLPLTIKVDLNDGIYVELKTQVLSQEVTVIYDGNIYVLIGELKFMATSENIEEAIDFILEILEEGKVNTEETTKELTNISIEEMLEKFKLSSDSESLTLTISDLVLTLKTNEKLKGLTVSYKEISGNFEVSTIIEKTEINTSEFVDYTYYKAIYDRISNFIESKKFYGNITVEVDGKEYGLEIKADLTNNVALQISTIIEGYNIQINMLEGVVYVKVNEQKVSYTLPENEEMLGALMLVLEKAGVTEENIAEEIEKITLKVKEAVNKASEITEEEVFEILSKLAVNTLTNNTAEITFNGVVIGLEICKEEVLEVKASYNQTTANVVLNDNTWTFDIKTEEYTTLDNLNDLVSTITDVVANKQFEIAGTVTYKTLTLPVTVKVDFENVAIEVNTKVLNKDISLIYINEVVYLSVDELRVKATNAEIGELAIMLVELLNTNNVLDIEISEIETMLSDALNKINNLNAKTVIEELSKMFSENKVAFDGDILNKLSITNEKENNLTVSYDNYCVSLNFEDGKLKGIVFNTTDIAVDLIVATNTSIAEINTDSFATVDDVKAIYNKVKGLVDAKAFDIRVETNISGYDFKGNIVVDLSDMSNPKFRIYNAYFNEYALDVTYFGNVLYAKVNELKVYLTINIENIQEVLNKLFYAYGTFTNTNTEAPNINLMIEDLKNTLRDFIENSSKDFGFEDFMEIYNKITINSISNFGANVVFDNISAVAEFNNGNILSATVDYNGIEAYIEINENVVPIFVPVLEDYSDITPLIDSLGGITDTFSTRKFGLSTQVTVMGELIEIDAYVDITDFANGPRVSATVTIADIPVYITYYGGTFYFEAKGLKMSATYENLKKLFEEDIKKFIETTLDKTINDLEENFNKMLETLDFLNAIIETENSVKLVTSMGVDLTLVEENNRVSKIVIDYAELGINADLKVEAFAGTISNVGSGFTVYENGIKLINTFIDFVTNETFNVNVSGNVGTESINLAADIRQKDAYINSVNAKGNYGANTNLEVAFLGEQKYIESNGVRNYNLTEAQANSAEAKTAPGFIFASYNGLKVKLDVTLMDKLVGLITGLFNIDLSVVYDLLNLNIPTYDMEVMQGLITGYSTETPVEEEKPEGEQEGPTMLETAFSILDSINLSIDGTMLTVNLTDGGKAIVKTEIVDGVTRIATLELVDIAAGDQKLNLLIDFYAELPSDMPQLPTREDNNYMDISTLGDFLETLVDTANFKHYKLQGVATVVLGSSATLASIDVFADIQLVKTAKGDGTYVWKPYIVAWLKNLPTSGLVAIAAIESAARENDASNHQTRIYIDENIYVYRTVYKYVKVQVGTSLGFIPKYEKVYGTHVLDKKVFGFDVFNSTDGMVEFINSILGLNGFMESTIRSAFNNPTPPDDYSPEKMFYNDVANNKRSYVYSNNRYNLLFNGKYLLNNSSIGDLSVDIGTSVISGNEYLSNLNFTMNASIVNIKLNNTKLVDYISHASYPTMDTDIGNELTQLKKGRTSFENYFNALAG